MKKIIFCCVLAAAVTFAAAGCEKQAKTQTEKKSEVCSKPDRITLEKALELKFGADLKFGWDAEKKRYITIVEMPGRQNPATDYSVTLLHNDQITHPDFRYELQGSVTA